MELEYQKQQQEKLNENFISDDEDFEENIINQDFYDDYETFDDEDDTNGYENGCIYRIYCKDPNIKDEYGGSSKNLYGRISCHSSRCNNITNTNNPNYHLPLYKFMREHGGWDNWIVEKLYDFPCNSLDELEDEEDEYVRNNPNATLQGQKVKLTAEEKKYYQKIRYHAMTPEQKEEYLAYQREKKRIRKEKETPEQREVRLQKQNDKYANRTDEKKEVDKKKAQEKHKKKWKMKQKK